jgi:hypothetical protein
MNLINGQNRSNIKTRYDRADRLETGSTHRQTDEGHRQGYPHQVPNHPHGIKVRLESGEVGRVKEIVNE